MSFIGRIYRQNIYGVMGTLVFHILVVLTFLLADINKKGYIKEEEILIEFPDILPEPEPVEEEIQEEEERNEIEDANESYSTNVASNRMATENITESADDFFDEEYLKEIESVKELASDVNNQLSKKILDLKDIKMPVVSTEEMERDSIKNVIYVGESNIMYFLNNRYHVALQNPLYLAQGGGKVIVDIVVNRQGKVIEATPQNNSTVRDKQIFIYARAAALGTFFNADDSAPARQKGSIHYNFIAQR